MSTADQETQQQVINEQIEEGNENANALKEDHKTEEIEDQMGQFEKTEEQLYIDLFSQYDIEKKGVIKFQNFIEIMVQLNKDPNQVAHQLLKKFSIQPGDDISLDQYQAIVSDIDLGVQNTSKCESENVVVENQRLIVTPEPKVVNLIRSLYEYQKTAESDGRYGEAKIAMEKIGEIQEQEIERQKEYIKSFQQQELIEVEDAQKEQFLEFTRTWDEYMQEYESAALASIEKMKQKHEQEVEELKHKTRTETKTFYRPSKQLLEYRQKEKNLVRAKKYSEAERIKFHADAVEQIEREQKSHEIDIIVDKKVVSIQKVQERAFHALLKRISKDRAQQQKNRQDDSQRLIMKNKNLTNELLQKHALELKNATENLRSNLSMLHTGQVGADIKAFVVTTTTRRLPSTQIKSNNYRSPQALISPQGESSQMVEPPKQEEQQQQIIDSVVPENNTQEPEQDQPIEEAPEQIEVKDDAEGGEQEVQG